MNDKIKKIQFFRKSDGHYYLYSLFNNLKKSTINNSILYTIDEQYIVFLVDDNELYFSERYVWSKINKKYSYSDRLEIIKELIELLFPEYIHHKINYSSSLNGNTPRIVSKNKLNKFYLQNNKFNTFEMYYVINDYKVITKWFKTEIEIEKNTIIYSNGCNWYNISKTKRKYVYNIPQFINNENVKKLDLNNKDDIKIFNKFKPHLLINNNNTNYYFQ